MAKITPSGHLKGTVGPVSYRVVNGQAIVQSRPGTMKQSKATQSSGFDFGRASRTAKAIRLALFPIVRDFQDAAFYRRFTGKVSEAIRAGQDSPSGKKTLWEGELSLLANAGCNIEKAFADCCLLQIDGGLNPERILTLSLPAFEIKEQLVQIPNASHATLCYLVITMDPETLAETTAALFEWPLSFEDGLVPETQWTTAPLPEHQLLVIASAIFYFRKNNLAGMIGLNNKQFHPCEITAVLRT